MPIEVDNCADPGQLRERILAMAPELDPATVTAADGKMTIAIDSLEDEKALVRRLLVLLVNRLVGVSETAELLGVSKQAVSAGEVSGLPEPVCRVRAGPLWVFTDIARLASTRNGGLERLTAAARLNGSAPHA